MKWTFCAIVITSKKTKIVEVALHARSVLEGSRSAILKTPHDEGVHFVDSESQLCGKLLGLEGKALRVLLQFEEGQVAPARILSAMRIAYEDMAWPSTGVPYT